MTDLDLSLHSLNDSSSKQKYSFPKTKRFGENFKPICDQLYNLPSSISKRATNLGYGQKSMGGYDKGYIPGVGAYTLNSQINPEKNKSHSISFGVSRDKMDQSGPLGHLKFMTKIPPPGLYEAKDVADKRAPSMRSRHPDKSFEMNAKNPGPGTYNHQSMGTNNYYLVSRYRNFTNGKISQVSRLQPIENKIKPKVGPADYNPVDSFNGNGRYTLAKHSSSNSCSIPKSQRQGVVQKSCLVNPGPGQYKSFSSFG